MQSIPEPRAPTGALTATLPVTVVVTAYRHADYIRASLDSVLLQKVPPREVIVIDDDSPDDTAARLEPLVRENRIRYVHQQNAGMAAARNVGAKLATSEYLYFLDDDDLAFPDALAWLVEELERHPDAAMAYGDAVLFSGTPPETPSFWSESREVERIPFMIFNQLGTPGQTLIRRSAFLEVGGFDPSIWGTDDWDLWLRLLQHHSARWAHRPVLAYRLHANNASRNVARMYESSLRVARRNVRNFPPNEYPALRRYCYRELRRYHVPRLQTMLASSAKEGKWALAAAAARAWLLAWMSEGTSYVALKLHLLRQGRWRLPPNPSLDGKF